ncbi:MAG: DegT/DnrJ/EryC1/StrS family aminotransferase [Calditrichaeota bacterium]|nr:DegT/DnrJ/EryC1/StrS family aminotransferase [Calditrichota bacterium]
MKNIPFHRPYITDEEINEVIDSIRSGWLTMGPKTIKFEKAFADYIGVSEAISVNSGTAALHLALKAVGIKRGDEVVIPAVTFTATGEVVAYFGAKPILVDIEKDTANIDPHAISKLLEKKADPGNVKAIIPVHFGGIPCEMNAIKKIAKKFNLKVIEDAAHALPAWYNSNKIGTIGDLTCFSFYATKTLTTGEGGMVTTNNKEWAESIRTARLHGISSDVWKRYSTNGSWYYEVVDAGFKYNMTDIQAALGLAQLRKLEWMWKKRRDVARAYLQSFQGISEIIPYKPNSGITNAWHLFTLILDIDRLTISRNQFIQELAHDGIGTSVHFIPLYHHPFYKKTYNYKKGDFPNSEWLYKRTISLPIFPGMTQSEVNRVIKSVLRIIQIYRKKKYYPVGRHGISNEKSAILTRQN